jgi:hypothetical protein
MKLFLNIVICEFRVDFYYLLSFYFKIILFFVLIFDFFSSCPLLHRTAGDTERRYHLRYYKTCMCVHDTDARGFCVKNGPHCAFAHGSHDMRPPVYDQRELQVSFNPL